MITAIDKKTSITSPATSLCIAPKGDTTKASSTAAPWLSAKARYNMGKVLGAVASAGTAALALSMLPTAKADHAVSYAEFTAEGLVITGGHCSSVCTMGPIARQAIAAAAGALGYLAPAGVITGPLASLAVNAWFHELRLLCVNVGCPVSE